MFVGKKVNLLANVVPRILLLPALRSRRAAGRESWERVCLLATLLPPSPPPTLPLRGEIS